MFSSFYLGKDGNKASDFYYVHDKAGRKNYYSKLTSKRVSKDNLIRGKIRVDEIQAKQDSQMDLIVEKQRLEAEIQKLQVQLTEVNLKIGNISTQTEEELKLQAEKIKQERIRRTKEFEQEQKRQQENFFEKIFGTGFDGSFNFNSNFGTNPNFGNSHNAPKPNLNVLSKHNIKTKSEWKAWLLKNHPDKADNPSPDIQEVIAAGKLKFNSH